MREQPRGSSVTVRTGAAACRGCRAPDTTSYWCFAPGIQSVVCISVSPPADTCGAWRTEIFHSVCVCAPFFHVEMDSVSLRDLKIAYGNVFLLLCSFCSALHLLDFTFSTKRKSHYLFSENNVLFLFAGAS